MRHDLRSFFRPRRAITGHKLQSIGITWNNHPLTNYFRVPRVPGFWPTGIQTEAKTKWCFVLFLHVREWWWSEPYLEHGEMHWAILGLSVSRPHRSEGSTWIFLGDYFGFLFDVSFDFWIFWHSSNRLEMHGMNGRVLRLFVFFVFFVLLFPWMEPRQKHIPVIQDVIHLEIRQEAWEQSGNLWTKH